MNNDRSRSPANAPEQTVWISSSSDLEKRLEANAREGLSSTEAQQRLVIYGRNILVWVLISAAIVAGGLGEGIDAIAITAIVVLNIGIGFYQEYRAENAMTALRRLCQETSLCSKQGI
ncbi:cation-transporting P-type ATPase [Armatimonas sp.]|uniref:cation-transporting P-type ATPase n=1 Tax=Armatimonas sp. TaxID=1872638 RepID=UPI00374DF87E